MILHASTLVTAKHSEPFSFNFAESLTMEKIMEKAQLIKFPNSCHKFIHITIYDANHHSHSDQNKYA